MLAGLPPRSPRRTSRAPRLVLFAGEVYPIAPLRKLRAAWPAGRASGTSTGRPRPTSARRRRSPPSSRADVDTRTRSAPPARARRRRGWSTSTAGWCPSGSVGELIINGPSVMLGYFGRPDLTAKAFFLDDQWRLVPDRRPRLRPRRRGRTASTAAATGWSRSAATGSSWARSRPPCTATPASTAPPRSPGPAADGVDPHRLRRHEARRLTRGRSSP